MDPRPGGDPLAGVEADLDTLESVPAEERVAIYGRIHHGLATALAGTTGDAGPQGAAPQGQRPPGQPGR